jgi:hypothetical protein
LAKVVQALPPEEVLELELELEVELVPLELEPVLEPELVPELVPLLVPELELVPELLEVPDPPVDVPPVDVFPFDPPPPHAASPPAITAAPRTKTTNPADERILTSKNTGAARAPQIRNGSAKARLISQRRNPQHECVTAKRTTHPAV